MCSFRPNAKNQLITNKKQKVQPVSHSNLPFSCSVTITTAICRWFRISAELLDCSQFFHKQNHFCDGSGSWSSTRKLLVISLLHMQPFVGRIPQKGWNEQFPPMCNFHPCSMNCIFGSYLFLLTVHPITNSLCSLDPSSLFSLFLSLPRP